MRKNNSLIFLVIFSIFIFSCTKNNISENDFNERYFEISGGYSLKLPEEWEAIDPEAINIPYIKYKIIMGPKENNFTPNLVFNDEFFIGYLTRYVNFSIDNLNKDFDEFELIQRNEFVTIKNLIGERIIGKILKDGKYSLNIWYFFSGKNGKKLVVSTALPTEMNKNYYELYDEIIKTFEWTK